MCTGDELWRSDGTPDGTTLVMDIPGEEPTLAISGDTLYFTATDYYGDSGGPVGLLLWRADDPPGAATPAQVVWTGGKAPGWISEMRLVGDALYFAAHTDQHSELWRSDGTPDGTTRLLAVPG